LRWTRKSGERTKAKSHLKRKGTCASGGISFSARKVTKIDKIVQKRPPKGPKNVVHVYILVNSLIFQVIHYLLVAEDYRKIIMS
jgi:hypothetical protein